MGDSMCLATGGQVQILNIVGTDFVIYKVVCQCQRTILTISHTTCVDKEREHILKLGQLLYPSNIFSTFS